MESTYVFSSTSIQIAYGTRHPSTLTCAGIDSDFLKPSANVYTNRSARVSVTSVKLRSFGMFAAMARTYSHYGKSGVYHQL